MGRRARLTSERPSAESSRAIDARRQRSMTRRPERRAPMAPVACPEPSDFARISGNCATGHQACPDGVTEHATSCRSQRRLTTGDDASCNGTPNGCPCIDGRRNSARPPLAFAAEPRPARTVGLASERCNRVREFESSRTTTAMAWPTIPSMATASACPPRSKPCRRIPEQTAGAPAARESRPASPAPTSRQATGR